MKKFKLERGSLDPVFVRIALLATLAVVISYFIGKSTTFIAADIAAIWALVSVRATFHTAIKDTVIQIMGTLLGGIVGFLAVQTYGFNVWLMAGLVLFSFAVGYLFRMGVDGSAIMGFTIIAVTSNAFSLESTEARISGVILGTIVATLLSLFVKRGTPQSRIHKELGILIERKKQILVSLSDVVSDGHLEQGKVFALNLSARALLQDFNKLLSDADDLAKGAKWSPLVRKSEADRIYSEISNIREDAVIVADMVESVDSLRTSLPKNFADKARISIENASRVLFDGDNLETQIIVLPNSNGEYEPTAAQILLANDLIASAEKLRKRRKKNKPQ